MGVENEWGWMGEISSPFILHTHSSDMPWVLKLMRTGLSEVLRVLLDSQKWFTYQNLRIFVRKTTGLCMKWFMYSKLPNFDENIDKMQICHTTLSWFCKFKYTMYDTFASKCWRWPVHVQSIHNSGSLMTENHPLVLKATCVGVLGVLKQRSKVCTGLISLYKTRNQTLCGKHKSLP